ncbi:MAG TPA: leucine-rich repeat domain-containing protein [Verrucomicrobiae bacterium]|jgi:hypothetical protein|nr:leucine-rich repeat domain-containing protein [Verrucomicrobiae bacterium]
MKAHIKNLLPLLLLLGLPGVAQAQNAFSTNADGSIYTYSTNADGSVNIVAYAGPPWVVTIPTNINGLTVTSIGEYAFQDTSLINVTIPNSVTNIGEGAFGFCTSLANSTIPSSVTTIGDEAFYDCTSLMSIIIPNNVTSIGEEAFDGCTGLTNVMIGNSVTSIGENAFGLTSLTSVTIPGSVTSIGYGAFSGCSSLTNATIDNGVTSIGEFAFEGDDSLTSVYFTGNAPTPTNDSTVFSGGYGYTDPATVYYLPGTTGWGAMFDGLPTAPWFLPNPQILNNGDILVQFSGGVPGALYDVEESSNLLTWTVAATDPANAMGSFSFEDTDTAGVPVRFYRVALAYTVGGTLTGLPAGDTVTLQDNGSDNLTLSANGTFTFPTALPNGHAYSVTVSATSGGTETTRTLMNGSGTICGANVTNVAVLCPPLYTGNMDVDMYNAAVADGTAHGGVPAVMVTENGGPIRVTAAGPYSYDVALRYYPLCQLAVIEGTTSCSSTILPKGPAIQFGTGLACGGQDFYGY